MILKNATIFDENFELRKADIAVCGDRISRIGNGLEGDDCRDCSGCVVSPGFVDIHIHGCVGADTCDGTREAIGKMAAHLLTEGVTSFCPTTMTVPLTQIRKALSVVRDCMEHPPKGAAVCGANLEGPYISAERRGAQKETDIRKPDWKEFRELYQESGGIIKLIDMAPECEGGQEFIRYVSPYCRVSLAHTEADYGTAKQAFQNGITHVTHLFNAMTGLHHRKPGAVGAVFDDSSVRAELICDGFHIAPAVLRIAFRQLGEDRTVIISDSMRAAGMPDGESELGGQKVFVKNGQARLVDGTIAGSTANLHQEVKNLIRSGIPVRQAIKSATMNPAREIGLEQEIGSIQVGKRADLVIMNQNWDIAAVIHNGWQVQNNT
ncbi:N-acetylglucosamine-6-phosphate deacetylase [Caproicibacterium lactatifermentans]|jgi:N-acetylglucosamine-6-phosphate deacetylase|uniref:N-acetylglucosamine-6-phosphate deacetylase n=1 Tax=Caproicibacterium lactatifermentans TaxID=2666138 RepID=A0ABX6PUZ1_9FIRM|nr:N-acetylglucosamine-6-phosphate deacetylase [Caproicibacterium lactatifermentans]QKO29872.1 N-acetylglucosamine-6-phosphate deacetylase [Caproicibacterium lactatifermentans]